MKIGVDITYYFWKSNEMFHSGNIVKLNERGVRHFWRKCHRKKIDRRRYMIVICYYKNRYGRRRCFVRDLFSDLTDEYSKSHLEYVCENKGKFIKQ